MTIDKIANRLVELCREGQWENAQKELYHNDVVSIEPDETGGQVTKGLDALLKKNLLWADMVSEVHKSEVSDPLVADGYFCCTMHMDVTLKTGQRVQSTELCIYKVVENKIVSERFFHH